MKPTPSSRYHRRSITRTLGSGLPSSVSSSAGPTCELKRMRLLSGDHAGLDAPCCMKVTCCASPPEVGMIHIWGLPLPSFFWSFSFLPARSPSRSETNASQLPSGDHAGLCALAGPAVNCRASPPSTGTTQMEERYVYARSSVVVTTKAMRFPSGEIRGWPTGLYLYRSSIVMLRKLVDMRFSFTLTLHTGQLLPSNGKSTH